MREAAELASLAPCAGDGYAEALRRAILPLGASWSDMAADQSGEVGNLGEMMELLADAARVDEAVRKYDAVTLRADGA